MTTLRPRRLRRGYRRPPRFIVQSHTPLTYEQARALKSEFVRGGMRRVMVTSGMTVIPVTP